MIAQVEELVGYFQPAEHAFDGEVIILTSRVNASGATQLIGALNGQNHITLVGEATGGSQEGPTAGMIWFVCALAVPAVECGQSGVRPGL